MGAITVKSGTTHPGAPHGLTATHQDQVNVDLLAFLGRPQKVMAA